MDEASGNALDAHGANDLTDNNSVGAASGKINGARDFESGSSQYLSHADNADLSTGAADFTLALWVSLESLSTMDVIAKLDPTASPVLSEYTLRYDSSINRFDWFVSTGGINSWMETLSNNFGALSTGTLYFVVVWHDHTNSEVGISVNDGTPDINSTGGNNPLNTASGFAIGRPGEYNGLYWDGLVDEVGFWKRVLTSGERTSLYNGGSGLAYPFTGGVSLPITWKLKPVPYQPGDTWLIHP